jgi:hypothetical protein
MILFGERNGERASAVIDLQVERLLSLAFDMQRVRDGAFPREVDLVAAPILDRWRVAEWTLPCLVGLSSGHPKLPGDNRLIRTSDLWLLSEDRTWARTLSRWYQLGRPAGHVGDDA